MIYFIIPAAALLLSFATMGQTPIPNNDFETWIDYGAYDDPQYWDTPNMELSSIPFFGTTVVNKSADHQSGSFSAKLETKNITFVGNIPGVVTLGQLIIDISAMSYGIVGGVPISDMPTHLKGFYRYYPVGGDTCAIGIGLLKWMGTQRDTIGFGVFSARDTVPDWAPFSAWIDYDTLLQPDTMNILAISSALETPTEGTVLYIDNFYLDYTVSVDETDPAAGIDIYNDKTTHRLLVFTDFPTPQPVAVSLYDMTGRKLFMENQGSVKQGRVVIPYNSYPAGIYILEILHANLKFTRKFFL